MQRYVRQLVDQMRAAAKTRLDARATEIREAADAERFAVRPPIDPLGDPRDATSEADESFAEHIADVEAYLEGPPEHAPSIAEMAGIPLGELPVTSALTEEEALALANAIGALIGTYGHAIDILPRPGCPSTVVYGYILDVLRQPGREFPGGGLHHDCGTHPPECPFGRWCACLDYWTEADYREGGGTADIPRYLFQSEADQDRQRAEMKAFSANRERSGDVPYQVQALTSRDYVPKPAHPDLAQLQATVDDWIATTGVRYFSELTNTAVLAEEVGEVARLSARLYGEQSFKRESDEASAKADWADELSDVLFVLTCLANQTGVDLTEAFRKGMEKRTRRDGDRHAGNEKLQRGKR